MSIPYIYKIKSKKTGKYYIGIQYGKKSNPLNFWKKYFTSCRYVLENIDEFEVVYVKPKSDAVEYERKLLSKLYSFYGRDKFCELMINRNLAPGIVLDDCERQRISDRLKILWKTGKMKDSHKKAKITRQSRIYVKATKSIQEREKSSERMKIDNPMFNENIRKKHKESINTEEVKEKKSNSKKGNTNVRGKSWYNNGIKCFMMNQKDVPIGWKKGRLNPHWNHKRKKV